jgi:hypothetical protein
MRTTNSGEIVLDRGDSQRLSKLIEWARCSWLQLITSQCKKPHSLSTTGKPQAWRPYSENYRPREPFESARDRARQ